LFSCPHNHNEIEMFPDVVIIHHGNKYPATTLSTNFLNGSMWWIWYSFVSGNVIAFFLSVFDHNI